MKPQQKTTPKGVQITPVGWRYGEKIVLVNPAERSHLWGRPDHGAYLVTLGAYGWTRLLVWARSAEGALDEAAGWCSDHAPGLLATEEVEERYRECLAELIADDPEYHSEDNEETHQRAQENAEVDTIQCDGGLYLNSWEVHLDGPLDRVDLLDILGRSEESATLRACTRATPDRLSSRRPGEFARAHKRKTKGAS